MGQSNSILQPRCSYHYLRTVHSEEGYCAECDRRFSSARAKDSSGVMYEKTKAFESLKMPPYKVEWAEKDIYKGHDEMGACRDAEVHDCAVVETDTFHQYHHCPRYFVNYEDLQGHLQLPLRLRCRPRSSFPHERHFCAACDTTYLYSSADHLRAVHMHAMGKPLTPGERAYERRHDCCVFCGVYFTSASAREAHAQDVRHHTRSVRQRASGRAAADIDSILAEAKSVLKLAGVDVDAPPSTLMDFPDNFRPDWLLPRLGSAVGKEHADKGAGSDESEFECPLCLTSDESKASLPCGHLFGACCILQWLAQDERCPICRNPSTMKNVHRLFTYP